KIKREELIGESIKKIFSGIEEFGLLEVFREVLETDIPINYPVIFFQDDKVKNWREYFIYKLTTGEIVAVYDDITERKKAEEKLKTLNKELQLIFDAVPALIFYKDTKNTLLRVNQYCADAMGRSKGELEGKNLFNFYPNDLAQAYYNDDLEVMQSKKPKFDIEEPVIHPDGTKRWISTSKLPVMDDEGNLINIIGFSKDITELKESEEKYRLITEKSNDLIYILNKNFTYNFINEELHLKMLGYTREDLIGNNAIKLIHPDDQERIRKEFIEGWRRGEGQAEARIRHKDGHYFWFEIKGRTFIDQNSKKKAIIISRNITERKALEETRKNYMQDLERMVESKTKELVQAEKLASIGMLSAGIAHEINNPIMGIINYAEIIKNELERVSNININSKPFSFLKNIIQESERIAKIATDLLMFARRDTDEYVYSQIFDAIDAAINLLTLKLKVSQIKINIRIQDELPKVPIRIQNIQQVILNILQNSIDALNQKFGPRNSNVNKKILIEASQVVEKKKNYIKLLFTDNGQGIKKENLKKVFDPFFTTKSQTHEFGTGLGLSVSYGIIEKHGGSIKIRSKWGRWTVVQILLPLERSSK
ncbi:MAG: PAS domain S-box protein, partial [Promethearchaeota archaeon]